MNFLSQHPEIRSALYAVQWGVNLVLGCIAVVLSILGSSPLWFVIAAGVTNFIWSYTGLTAERNVQPNLGGK